MLRDASIGRRLMGETGLGAVSSSVSSMTAEVRSGFSSQGLYICFGRLWSVAIKLALRTLFLNHIELPIGERERERERDSGHIISKLNQAMDNYLACLLNIFAYSSVRVPSDPGEHRRSVHKHVACLKKGSRWESATTCCCRKSVYNFFIGAASSAPKSHEHSFPSLWAGWSQSPERRRRADHALDGRHLLCDMCVQTKASARSHGFSW